MHREPNGAALGGNRPSHALADPPVGVGAESKAPGGIEFFDSALEAKGSFLNQVKDFHPPLLVFLGHSHHKPEVGLDHVVLRPASVAQAQLEFFGLDRSLLSPSHIARIDSRLQLLQ